MRAEAQQYIDRIDAALDLLRRMIAFDQDRRATVAEVLAHPYLAPVRRAAGEPTCTRRLRMDEAAIARNLAQADVGTDIGESAAITAALIASSRKG